MANTSSSPKQLHEGILSGDRTALARAITLAESTLLSDRKKCEQLLKHLLPRTGNSIRIGITGVPGVGKSTFIEAFGGLLTRKGKKIGVLTIDPSSRKTKGSILGDKTRMQNLSTNPNVFIRPSPSSFAHGGVGHHTREAILFCEAAGYDVIFIETVGVGQSETEVRSMVDFFLLLILPGAGDELQGIKKGIMEMADGVVITKTDGENIKAARQAQADAAMALQLQPHAIAGWKIPVLKTSALEVTGLEEVWAMIMDFQGKMRASGDFDKNRTHQKVEWLDSGTENLFQEIMGSRGISRIKDQLLKKILNNQLLPSEAARALWKIVSKKVK